MNTNKDIVVLTGAGQLGMACVRRMAYGNKIFIVPFKAGISSCHLPKITA